MKDLTVEALTMISTVQPKVLEMIKKNGFVFEIENIGNTPGRWDHLAFALYTEICEIDSIARQALKTLEE